MATSITIALFLIINVAIYISQSQAIRKESNHKTAASAPKSPSPNNNNNSPIRRRISTQEEDQNPTRQYMEYLEACQDKMPYECADQITKDTFNYTATPDQICCKKYLEMGPDCHNALIQRNVALIKNNEAAKKRVLAISWDMWRRCERVAPPPKNARYPKLPPPEFLPGYDSVVKDCKAKLTENCGREIIGVILDRSKDWWAVGGDCCRQVVRMGVECHVALLDNLAKDYKDDQGYIKDKGNHVWKHCVVSEG